MEMFLKNLENADRDDLTSDCSEQISLLIYIANLTEDIITSNDVEAASKIVYIAIGKISKNNYNVIENLLEENDQNRHVTLANYKIYIRNKWLFQLILLSSIKHSDIFYANKTFKHDTTNFLRFCIKQIIKYIFIENQSSVHLLRTLLLILTKHNEVLTCSLSLNIMECMGRVALSPVTGFKHYAQSISKITITSLSKEDKNKFLDIDLLPVRGVDMYDVIKLFSNEYIKENKHRIVKKVLNLFLNNIESKDGGCLYESVLFYSFEEWKVEIWPLFLSELRNVEYEGEFFQSLRKYWIRLNVSSYKDEFYLFLRNEAIDTKVKVYVLLESRRRGYAIDSCNSNDVQNYYNIETANLCLKIVSTYHKKSLCPNANDIAFVQNYFYSNLNQVLDDEDIKSLQWYFSQIFLHAHYNLRKNKENLTVYVSVLESIYQYCYNSLKTDFCEVGAQILLILWNIATGSHKSLNVLYKIEKKDFYEEGGNILYKELKSKNIWKFENEELIKELLRCFIENQGCGENVAKLLYKYYLKHFDTVDIKYFKNIIDKENSAKLQNIEKIKNHSELVFRNIRYRKEVTVFLEDVKILLSKNLDVTQENCCDESIFKNIIYMKVLMVALKNKLGVEIPHQTVEKCLDVVDFVLENNFLSGRGYKTTKVLEAFVNSIMLCIIQNKDTLWVSMNKKKVLGHLIGVIQRSNMKRPVSLSIEVLKHLGAKMDENEVDWALKIQFLDEILKSVYNTPTKQELKIRRNPESRLVIHAMCSSERNPNKPLLKWILNFLLDVITSTSSSDSSISSALHSIEILVSDNNLHGATLPFIYRIIVQCVELFKKPSWIVRNADLQLAKALIERFYGVSINNCDRPKNIDDLFVLFPDLSIYFFKVLAADELDERAVIVFQFFFESQVREHIFTQNSSKVFRDCFLILLSDIIKKYPNNFGKMAVRSYTSLCMGREIPKIILDITDFLKSNFESISKNIFGNFTFLLRELYDKYTYKQHEDKKGLAVINFAVADLLKYLRAFDSPLFSFLLFKIQPTNVVLKEIALLGAGSQNNYEKRLWLHNIVPFLLVNARPNEMSNILRQILSPKLLYCMQVKVLSILVSRFENNDFNNDTLIEILKVLFEKSVMVNDSETYVLICYFKTILLFCEKTQCANFLRKSLLYIPTSSLYKTMIFVLYFSGENSEVINEQQNFYKTVESLYLNSISISEEIDNDIMSTLIYFKKAAPEQFYFNLLKLVFHFSVRNSTCLEAYNFISFSTNRTYCSILHALKAFLSVQHLARYLDENLIAKFLLDVKLYVDSLPGSFEDFDGYYSVESDNLVPKFFLQKMLRSGADHSDI